MIRIVIVDDHALIREGVKKIFRATSDLQLVGEAIDIDAARRLIAAVAPDVVVLDLSLNGVPEPSNIHLLRQRFPTIPVVVLSMFPEARLAAASLQAGAAGYVCKSMATEELVLAIRAAIGNGDPNAIQESVGSQQDLGCDRKIPNAIDVLTPRELEVTRLLGEGLLPKQVASELGISVSSVNTYRCRIFRKMGWRNNAMLIRYVVEAGLGR